MLPSGKKAGGAPANFAYHCGQLGGDVRMVSRVGDDPLGEEILDYCRKSGLSTELIGKDPSAPTGTVDVVLDTNGQATYTINEHVAWDFLEAGPEAVAWASTSDAIGFGSLAARSERNRDTLRTLAGAASPEACRVLDLNLRDPFCERRNLEFVLSCANVLKLNDEELDRFAEWFGIEGETAEARLRGVSARFGFRLVILTLGAEGSWLATETERIRTPGVAVRVVDTVGAGDAFTAVAVMGLLSGKSLTEIGERANALGAYVSMQSGAMPPIPERFRWDA